MTVISPEAAKVFNTFGLTKDQQTHNIRIVQDEYETFDEFLTKVKTQADRCVFGMLKESLVIKGIIVVGIRNITL